MLCQSHFFIIAVYSVVSVVGAHQHSMTVGDILRNEQLYSKDECPTWYYYDANNTCNCISSVLNATLPGTVFCDNEIQTAYLLNCFCVTVNNQEEVVVSTCSANCATNLDFSMKSARQHYFVYIKLPDDLSELNKWICGQWNRTGTNCGNCVQGFYPLAYSYNVACVDCDNHQQNWIKLFAIMFIPSTAFYFFVLFFKLNVVSSNLHGCVLVCQIASTPAISRMLASFAHKNLPTQVAVKILGTFYGIWNLDFFRYFNNYMCLNVSSLTIISLDYIVCIYPLSLIVLSYTIVTLHGRDVRFVILLGKPIRYLLRLFHRNWDSKTSLIDAYATFFILSFTKVLSVSFDLLCPTIAYSLNVTTGTILNKQLLLYNDGTVKYFSKDGHLVFAVIAIAMLLIFIIGPMILLLLYPYTWFKRCLSSCHVRNRALKVFVNSFYVCYKDGQQAGTYDCRWFSIMYLLLRICLFITVSYFRTGLAFPAAALVLGAFLIVQLIVQPYRMKYSHYGTVDMGFILGMVISFTAAAGIQLGVIGQSHNLKLIIAVLGVCALLPGIYIVVLSLYWLISRRKNIPLIHARFRAWRLGYGWNEITDTDSLPDRMVDPSTYRL